MTIFGTTGLGHKAALGYANLRRDGKTLAQIGRMFGITGEAVRLALTRGCPVFVVPPPLPSLPKSPRAREASVPAPAIGESRPDWSYPDEITLRIVRAARDEMERAG